MKERIKRSFSLLMALTLVFITGLSSNITYASETNAGTITINGTVNKKEYRGYKIFDLTYSGDSEDSKNVSYTISEDWKDFFTGEIGSKYIVDNNENSLNPIVVENGKKYINITEENVKEFAKDAFSYAAKKQATFSQEAEGETLTIHNKELGYYLIYPVGATDIKENQESIVSLTSTTPNAEINIKSVYPTIEKKADKTTADLGDPITFTITGKVPDTTGYDEYSYVITDSLSTGLTLDKASIDIYVGENKIESLEESGVTQDTTQNQKLIVTFDMTKFQENVGKEVRVTYKASLNKDAVIGKDGNNNSVILNYNNDPKDTSQKGETPKVEVKVYNAKIQIKKTDVKDENKKLKGAKFILKNEENKYYQISEDGNNVSWIEDKENATTLETNDDGLAEFKGLSAGNYKIEETQAPDGYNKLTNDIKIEIKDEDAKGTGIVQANVQNNAGVELPGTGGIGTTIFTIVGGGLIILAAYSLFMNKSGRKEK